VIKRPMDLQTIRESVQQKKYHSREEFLADIKQVGLVSHVPGVSMSVAHFPSVSVSVAHFPSVSVSVAHFPNVSFSVVHFPSVSNIVAQFPSVFISVAVPDPQDPYVFVPPGSGSIKYEARIRIPL
jgi:hypothetical protein